MADKKPLEDRLIDRMHQMEEEYRDLLELRAANRESLRNLAKQGELTKEQIAMVNEIYTERKRGGKAEPAVV